MCMVAMTITLGTQAFSIHSTRPNMECQHNCQTVSKSPLQPSSKRGAHAEGLGYPLLGTRHGIWLVSKQQRINLLLCPSLSTMVHPPSANQRPFASNLLLPGSVVLTLPNAATL